MAVVTKKKGKFAKEYYTEKNEWTLYCNNCSKEIIKVNEDTEGLFLNTISKCPHCENASDELEKYHKRLSTYKGVCNEVEKLKNTDNLTDEQSTKLIALETQKYKLEKSCEII